MRGDAVRHRHHRAGIELLRVQPLPPFALAVILGELEGVIALAGARAFRVIAIGDLEPVPGYGPNGWRRRTSGRAPAPPWPRCRRCRAWARRACCSSRGSANRNCRNCRDGWPGDTKYLRAGLLVEVEQLVRIPVLGLPAIVDLHEAGIGGMAVSAPGDGRTACWPWIYIWRAYQSPGFGHALRAPMRPDAELGVAEPVGRLVLGRQRFPVGLERARRDIAKARALARDAAGPKPAQAAVAFNRSRLENMASIPSMQFHAVAGPGQGRGQLVQRLSCEMSPCGASQGKASMPFRS